MTKHKISVAALAFLVTGGGGFAFGDELKSYSLDSTVISAAGYE